MAVAGSGLVDLMWDANAETDLAGYHVYRATASGGPYARITGTLLTDNFYADSAVTGGTAYFYVVRAVDTSANESGNSNEASATPAGGGGGGGGGGGVLLSEVLYDVASGDDGFEWVELFNPGASAVDLSGFCLGNGGTSYTTSTAQLSGTVAAGATFVVGGPTSSATNANPSFDLVLNFSPDLQNSGTAGDGVALFDVPCAQVGGTTVPIDAVVYGPNNSSGLIDETGVAGAPEVGDAPAGSSIERIDPGGAWQIQGSPTPNSTSLQPPTGCTVDMDCSDSLFCNGAEVCNAGTCEAGSAPVCDDGLFCNGAESCNEGTDSCDAGAAPACDDGLYCNGAEICNEGTDSCDAGSAPVCDDGLFCNGAESCNEGTDSCDAGSAPVCDDGLFCNGVEACNESTDTCDAGTPACDPGSETCNEATDTCDPIGSGAPGDLLLSEVLYDVSGTDDGLEWVEIYNNDTVAIDLSGFSLGNGGTDYTTSLVQLAGTLQPGATFVVGGPTSSAVNGNPAFDQAADFTPDFQNSGTTGDGVALFNVPASAVTAATVPIDAVVYGPNNNNGLIDESGTAGAPEVGAAPAGSSIERLDVAGNWQIQGAPTPNASPLNPPASTEVTFTAIAAEDGWVRESSENSNVGGRTNSSNTGSSALRAGDNNSDRQYKGVVSFDTSQIPDGATIVSAQLRLRRGTASGTNPFTTHGTCWVDVHAGGLGGSTALANGDFEAVAAVARTTSLSNAAANGDWSEGSLDPVGLTAVNKAGTTQLRFYFDLDDNDDRGNDYIGYYSADNATAANHPQLVVIYQ